MLLVFLGSKCLPALCAWFIALSLSEHTYGKLHCQNNSGLLKKTMGFLEVSRKTFPSVGREYMVTRVGRSEPAWLRKVQPWICVSCVKGVGAVPEVMEWADICREPWSCCRRRRLLMNVSEDFSWVLSLSPIPEPCLFFEHLQLVKQLLGRADLVSLQNKRHWALDNS